MNETKPVLDSIVETPPPNISEAIIPMEVLISMGEEGSLLPWDTKTVAILRSMSSILSVFASSVLIWMILRSKKRLAVPYHRILFGMGVSDFIFSISNAHFNALIADDLDYAVWNARGNLASSVAVGFLSNMGIYLAVLYACSLNIYFLLVVKYNMKDREIRYKYEKWLHGLPIGIGLGFSIFMAAAKHNNPDLFGTGQGEFYDAPHCEGFEKGEIREGFKIPCWRGREPSYLFGMYFIFFIIFGAPIIILATLRMLHVFVKNQEKRMTRYGAGALDIATPATPQPPIQSSTSFTSRIRSRITSVYTWGRSSASNETQKSRAFLTRAMLFSGAYFLTWIWVVTINAWSLATDFLVPPPNVIIYLFSFFTYLQGFYNLLIFLQPKLVQAKRKHGISWCGALVKVFRPEATVSKFSNQAYGKKASTKTRDPMKRNMAIVSPPLQKKNVSTEELSTNEEDVDEEELSTNEEDVDEEELSTNEEEEEVDEEIQEQKIPGALDHAPVVWA